MSKRFLICVLMVGGALLCVPALAAANVYCVDDTPLALGDNDSIDPSCEAPVATIAGALGEAANHAGADTVLVGPGEFTLPNTPNASEVSYNVGDPANALILRGTGETNLTMGGTAGSQSAVYVFAPAGSRVEGLGVKIPANVDGNGDRGFVLGGGVKGSDLRVDGPLAVNARGYVLGAGTAVDHVAAAFPVAEASEDSGVTATSGAASVADSRIQAAFGIQASGSAVSIERSTLLATLAVTADSGTVTVRDSVIDLGTVNGVGVNLANNNAGSLSLNAVLAGDTIVGGGANSVGVRVQADNGQETATATVGSTVIEGPATTIQLLADNGREATAAVSYSNYDASRVTTNANLDGVGAVGQTSLAATNVAHSAPGFVDPAASDFHLASGSALIDAGDPAPVAGELDLDGQARAIAGGCPSAAGRRDIGADELVPICAPETSAPAADPTAGGSGGPGSTAGPVNPPARTALPGTALAGKHRVLTRKGAARVTLKLSSTSAGASFECSIDSRAYRPCGAVLKLHLKPGTHTVSAIAATAGGSDPTPVRFSVRVVRWYTGS